MGPVITIGPFFMIYEKEIIQILTEAGRKGLSVHKISMHIFNAHNDFFNTVDKEEISRIVYSYLHRHSQSPDSPIEHTGKRGVYRLNMSSKKTSQLMLKFVEDTDAELLIDEETDSAETDKSLSLFPF